MSDLLFSVGWSLLPLLAHEGEHGGLALPPLHPILVNFTAALVPASLLSDLLGRALRRESLTTTGFWTLLYAAIVTPLTAAAGWLWLRGMGDMGHGEMAIHQSLGTALALAVPALALWRSRAHREGRAPEGAYLAAAALLVAAVVVQGHVGGLMSFGHATPAKPAAGPAAPVREDLGHYHAIRVALAADKVEGVKEHAQALAKSRSEPVANAARSLAAAGDIAAARRAFGDLSRALVADVQAAANEKADLGAVYVFECPMAKPFGRWLQADEDMRNPYYGAEMLRCGKKVASFGAPGEAKGGGHGEHAHEAEDHHH